MIYSFKKKVKSKFEQTYSMIKKSVINPANILWGRSFFYSEATNFKDQFLSIFNNNKYLKLLIGDFEKLIDGKFADYEQLFNDALGEIKKKQIGDAEVHKRLEEMT